MVILALLWRRLCLGPLLLMLLMEGARRGGAAVVVDMSPGAAEIRIVQRRHQCPIVAGQILQLIGASVALDKRGLLLMMMLVMFVWAITVRLACEIL